MVNVLIALILISALRKNSQEQAAIFLFCAFCLFFKWLGGFISVESSYFYYLGAAVTELLIIFVMSKLSRPSRLIVNMQNACLCFICLHLFGWILFESEISHILYNVFCGLLFILVFVIINIGKNNGMGYRPMDSMGKPVFSYNFAGNLLSQKNKTEITP